jgi:O-antigen/teichoic acid export membrane protein
LSTRFNKIKELSSIGIADITGSIISALFWFYLATLIGPEAYGEIHYFISIAAVASTISLLGATQTLLVYSAKKVKIHSTLYSLNLIVGVVSATIVAFIVKDLSVGLLVIGYMVFAIAWSDVLGKKYYKTYTKYILVQKILMVSLTIGFFFILGKDGIILGMAISFLLGFLRIFRGFRETKIDLKLFKKKFSFISYNFIHSLTWTLGSMDKLIIAPLFGFVVVGNYALGMQFLSLLMILPVIVGKYLIPQESSGEENKKLKKIIIFISIGIGGLGVLIGPEIASFLFPKYSELDSIIRIMSLGVIPATITLTYSAKFLGNEKGNYGLFLGITKIFIMIISIIILGQLYGIEGIAVGIVLSETSVAVFSAMLAKKMELSKV